MIRRVFFALIFFLFTGLSILTAAESKDKYIRLNINEKTGSFSLYYLTDPSSTNYEPLFNTEDPSTSYLTVNVKGVTYHLGKSMTFRTRFDRIDGNPAIIYESPFLLVSKVFVLLKTASSATANGIKLTITIENKSRQETPVGLRVLIDTHLGEERGGIPFITENMAITKELILDSSSGERYWISKGSDVSLMGNIINLFDDDSKEPDFLHFANWKMLNDVPWKAPYREGRAFNSVPLSIGDSAVCYYYEPEMLAGGESFKYTIFLTTEDTAWYSWQQTGNEPPKVPAPVINAAPAAETPVKEAVKNEENDAALPALRRFQDIIEQFIAGKILLNEQDLLEIEMFINRFDNKD